MTAPAWLTARPIAHRGLHDRAAGRIENSLAAAEAAVAHGFAIECDVQLTADGDAVVFHDFSLDRLAGSTGAVSAMTSAALAALAYRDSGDRITPLTEFLAVIAGRVPLVCEIKSRFNGDIRLAERTARIVAGHSAPIVLKSFDPAILAHLRREGARLGIDGVPLGIIAQARAPEDAEAPFSAEQAFSLANLLHYEDTRPDFLSYNVKDLPHAVPYLCRAGIGLPVMSWTVRTPADRSTAARWADQMVFEGFVPD